MNRTVSSDCSGLKRVYSRNRRGCIQLIPADIIDLRQQSGPNLRSSRLLWTALPRYDTCLGPCDIATWSKAALGNPHFTRSHVAEGRPPGP